MKKFRTKFDVQHFDGCKMNPYDAVDRLSYVDSTTQIVSMLKAGVSARLQRSQLMTDELDLNSPSMPVYAPDIADAYRQLHQMQDELKENERKRSEAYKAAIAAKAAQQSPEKGAVSDLPSST